VWKKSIFAYCIQKLKPFESNIRYSRFPSNGLWRSDTEQKVYLVLKNCDENRFGSKESMKVFILQFLELYKNLEGTRQGYLDMNLSDNDSDLLLECARFLKTEHSSFLLINNIRGGYLSSRCCIDDNCNCNEMHTIVELHHNYETWLLAIDAEERVVLGGEDEGGTEYSVSCNCSPESVSFTLSSPRFSELEPGIVSTSMQSETRIVT
jgi:hypothetical protein